MARLSPQGSVSMISDNVDAVTNVIASATKAKPCVITLAAGGGVDPVVGDIVVPRNTGWNSIEGMPFRVSAAAGGANTLEDNDTSKKAHALSGAPAVPGASVVTPTGADKLRY